MNCEYFKQNVVLLVYDELADDVLFEMRQHAERCPACNQELESAQQFRADVNVVPVLEPTPNLLTASRLRLQEALETAEQPRGLRRWIFDPVDWLRQIRFSPALAAAILIVGFAGGLLTAFKVSTPPIPGVRIDQNTEASIAGIRDITQDPNTNTVQINYDKLLPASTQGSIDNPDIEKLLLYAARNQNPGVRVESVSILSRKCHDAQIRESIMRALLEDRNPGVRLQALDGLEQYVKEDIQVRNAVIQALLNDANPGVRTEALRLLQPLKADSAVRNAFEQLAKRDGNHYIRSESERTLASLPPID